MILLRAMEVSLPFCFSKMDQDTRQTFLASAYFFEAG